jgi:hypothetical protein
LILDQLKAGARAYLCNPLLLVVLVEDGAAVLRAHVIALPVGRGGVVDAVEVLHLRRRCQGFHLFHFQV